MSHNLKLESLSMEELQAVVDDAQKLLAGKVEAKRAELLKQLQELDAIGGRGADTPKATRQRSPSTYTHKHPKNGHLWLGRGGTPTEWRDIITPDMTKEERAAELAKHRISL